MTTGQVRQGENVAGVLSGFVWVKAKALFRGFGYWVGGWTRVFRSPSPGGGCVEGWARTLSLGVGGDAVLSL